MLALNLDNFANPEFRWRALAIIQSMAPLDASTLSNEAARLVAAGAPGEAVLDLAIAFSDAPSTVIRELYEAALAETGVRLPSEEEVWALEVRVRAMPWRTSAQLDALARSIADSLHPYYYADRPESSEAVRAAIDLASELDQVAPEWDSPPADPAGRDRLISRAIQGYQSSLTESFVQQVVRITSIPD